MELSKDYQKVVAIALAINLQCFATSFAVGAKRKKIFNQQFMKANFGAIHKQQLGEEVVKGGYPDTGNGKYSQKLSYKDWYQFNILQRIHLNYVQNASLVTTAILAAGLYHSRAAFYLGCLYILGRALYSTFYKKSKGALNIGRLAGAGICMLGILGAVGVFGYHFFKNF